MKTVQIPNEERTIWLPSDVHCGAVSELRLDKVTSDVDEGMLPESVVAVVCPGDCVDGVGDVNTDEEAVTFINWWNGLRYIRDGAEYTMTPGNHDLLTWTAAQWAAAMQQVNVEGDPLVVSATHHTLNLDFCRVIVPYAQYPVDLVQAELDWLEDELAAAGDTPVVLVLHAPLYDTYTTDEPGAFPSTRSGFFAKRPGDLNSDAILAILNAHTAGPVCVVAGHNHPDFTSYASPGRNYAMMKDVGDHSVAHFLCPAIYFNGAHPNPSYGPIWSLFLTVHDDRFEGRPRNHSAGVWGGPQTIAVSRFRTVFSFSFADVLGPPPPPEPPWTPTLSEFDQEVLNLLEPELYWNGEFTESEEYGQLAMDASGNSRNGVAQGSIVLTGDNSEVTPGDTRAFTFDGANDYISSSYSPFVQGSVRTFFGMAKRTDNTGFDVLVAGNAAASYPSVRLQSGSQDVRVVSADGGESEIFAAAWPGNGVWVFWMVVIDLAADQISLYINGALVATNGHTGDYNAAAGTFKAGAGAAAVTNPFLGTMSKIGVSIGNKGAQAAAVYAAAIA